jgi:hypothetical protein
VASERTRDRWVVLLGVTLLLSYIVQARFELVWPWLARQQANDTYKILTGSMLAGFLLWQWSLGNRRQVDPVGAVRRHQLAGAFAPLALYIHASRFAYGYLLVLALGYLGITAIGLLHRVAVRRRGLFVWWFVIHVATVTMLLLVVAYHIVIALAYE